MTRAPGCMNLDIGGGTTDVTIVEYQDLPSR